MMTVEDCLKKAWSALLAGDTEERDRWCKLAMNLQNGVARYESGGKLIEGEPIKPRTEPHDD